MPEQPMYNGVHTQLGGGATPLPIPDIGIKEMQKSNQRGAEALDTIAAQFFQIQDFGESQKIERQLREQKENFDTEFQRRATLPPNSENALYDERGSLIKSQLDNLVKEYAGNIGELRGNFINPETRMRSDILRQNVSDELRLRAYGKAAVQTIQNSRTSYENNLKSALAHKDYPRARHISQQAGKNQIISQNQHVQNSWDYSQLEQIDQFLNNLQTDPIATAGQMEEGRYNGISPDMLRKLEPQLELALRQQTRQIPLSAEEQKHLDNGGNIRPRYAPMPGDTENMVKWRQAANEGSLHLYKDDINTAWRTDVFYAPSLKTQEKYQQWKNQLLKTYCDPQTGFGVPPDQLTLAMDDRIDHLLALRHKTDSLDAAKLFHAVKNEHIAPGMYKTWRDKAETWYWTQNGRDEEEGPAAKSYQTIAEIIRHKSYTDFLTWQKENPKTGYWEQYQRATAFLADNAETILQEKQFQASDMAGRYNSETWRQKDQGEAAALQQQQTLYEKNQQQKAASAKQKKPPLPPLPTVIETNIQPIAENAPGAYISRENYQELVKRLGDKPLLMGTLPGRGSRRAFCKIPVLGWHDGSGTLLTRGARHGQLGKIGTIPELEIQFTKGEQSKPVPDRDWESFITNSRRKENTPAAQPSPEPAPIQPGTTENTPLQEKSETEPPPPSSGTDIQ